MAKNYMQWKTKGMNRDSSVSAFSSEFSFENRNLRLSTNEGNTLMSWVNERGPKILKLYINTNPSNSSGSTFTDSIEGTVIGTAVLNGNLVLFTHQDSTDRIYAFSLPSTKVDYDLYGRLLFKGNLNFDTQHPIETLVSYESEIIQKVYWTDNKNQPRVINIAPFMNKKVSGYTANTFNFIQELALKESVKVTKMFGSGEFPAGVIQYAFTYYNKYGQESCVFNVTPLYCIAYRDRGGKPGEKIANSFKIDISGVDTSFDYLRIYSILRTSRDAVPLVKRVQDIEITDSDLTFTDSGYSGDTVDPTELLYKGGEEIIAKTMEQKDGTLFLGNIQTAKVGLPNGVASSLKANAYLNTFLTRDSVTPISKENIPYTNIIDYSGFKNREYYRFGIQFQYKTGKWSEPVWLKDYKIDKAPFYSISFISTVQVEVTLGSSSGLSALINAGYKRARLMMAQPTGADRTIICQGIANPTLYSLRNRYIIDNDGLPDPSKEGPLYAQSSWIFRPKEKSLSYGWQDSTASDGGGYIPSSNSLITTSTLDHPDISGQSSLEIGTCLDSNDNYYVSQNMITIHSPEIEFDESLWSTDFSSVGISSVGEVVFTNTFGDIDIQTSTPTIGAAQGFYHKSVKTEGNAALVSGLFYEDFMVDDNGDDGKTPEKYSQMHVPVKWPVALWQRNGSLNNDVERTARSARLLKKKVSNYHLGMIDSFVGDSSSSIGSSGVGLFQDDELSIIKVNGHTYMGNIDTMVAPQTPDYKYFAGNPWRQKTDNSQPTFLTKCYYRLGLQKPGDTTTQAGIFTYSSSQGWYMGGDAEYKHIGDKLPDLCETLEPLRIKYKSTPHLVADISNGYSLFNTSYAALPLVEVTRAYDSNVLYGGQSDDALKANTWIPISNPVELNTSSVNLQSNRGDTYCQIFECLKTYAFTKEDVNQVVDIASFACESHVNMDGRYDRNRGQVSNLNMSPTNFNLMNPVYSQLDNFFNYKILDSSYYDNKVFTNQLTWTKTKESGADTDLWTNITLASTLELDGDKGTLNKLTRLNNQLIAFQDSGISQILYNENTQITSTEGVPIEIANSGKVQGKRYFTDRVGCSDKWSLVQTPGGIYFMDSSNKGIYLFNGQLENVTSALGFDAWAKQTIPSQDAVWNPVDFTNFATYYDKLNQDVLFISADTTLAFSERLKAFTSFYDYDQSPYFCNLGDMGIWVRDGKLWRHQAGEYCNFFGKNKPYSMTLIANQNPQTDKVFTNMELRACVEEEGTYDAAKDKFVPTLPFDTLEAWDEYQHGKLALTNRGSGERVSHGGDKSLLARKFRMWRCDIPRDNAPVDDTTETALGIKRFKARPLDRIRNPWAYIRLEKDAAKEGSFLSKTEIHDLMLEYFA